MNNRNPREIESRAVSERPKQWRPPTTLPDPRPMDGWVFRWIRKSILSESDEANMSLRMREGWEPVLASAHPEVVSELKMPVAPSGNIEVGGLVLAKMSAEMNEQMRQYYENFTEKQTRSIDEQLDRENDSRMPMLKPQRRSQISFGQGR